jgi:hypothetical protein
MKVRDVLVIFSIMLFIITTWLLVRERTRPTERPPLVGKVSANFCAYKSVAWSAQQIPTDQSRYFFFQVAPQL